MAGNGKQRIRKKPQAVMPLTEVKRPTKAKKNKNKKK